MFIIYVTSLLGVDTNNVLYYVRLHTSQADGDPEISGDKFKELEVMDKCATLEKEQPSSSNPSAPNKYGQDRT